MKYVGKALSILLCLAAVAICVILVVMSYVDRDPEISEFLWTKEAYEKYSSAPDAFYVEYVKAYEDDHYFTEDGYFSVRAVRWIPSLRQFQMTVRYNDSTLENLVKDKVLSDVPKGEVFGFALEDSEGVIYPDYQYKTQEKGRYNYYRLVFDGVNIKGVDDIKINIYLLEDMKNALPEHPINTLPLYYSQLPRKEFNIKKELKDGADPNVLSSNDLLK